MAKSICTCGECSLEWASHVRIRRRVDFHFLPRRTAAASAIAAVKLRRPVLIHNERVDDMTMMGGREPIVASYRVAFDKKNGSTNGLDMLFEMDGKCTIF